MPDLADRPVFGVGEMADEPRRSPRLGIAVAAVVIAAFVAGIWYVYDRGVRRGDLKALPVIQADSGPIKSSPADAGGMKVPHVDGEMPRASAARTGKVEDILPPPERPLPEKKAERAAPPAEAPKPLAAAPVEPPKVETAPPPPPVAAVEVAPRPTPAAPPSATPPAVAKEAAPPPAPETAAPAAVPPATAEKAAATPVAAVAPAAGRAGGFRIQLASVGDKKSADNEWRRLSRANADVLGKLSPTVATVDLPGKGTFHRLSAGPFPDRGAAAQACEALHKRKVGCFVVAP